MITRTMKWVSLLALVVLLPILWQSPMANATVYAAFLVWSGAAVVFVQAVATRKFIWAAGFAAIAVAFNPVVPLTVSRGAFVIIDLASIAAFLTSLAFLNTRPRLSIASVTDTSPRGEAL
jgi:hypothetical protein